MNIRIKDWHTFQHFKDRRPPWIKLYREILDDYDIAMISDRSFRILVNLWLLASEDKTGEGNLPHLDAIAHRLRIKKDSLIRALEECDKFLIREDINPISGRYQNDRLETETETETETKTKTEKRHNLSELVEEIWKNTPKMGRERSSKKQLTEKLKKIRPLPQLEKVLVALEAAKKTKKWTKDNGQFVEGIHIWIDNEKWNGDYDPVKTEQIDKEYEKTMFDNPIR